MKIRYHILIISLVALSNGCQGEKAEVSVEDVRIAVSEKFHGLGDLQRAVLHLYESFVEKDWEAVYGMRLSNFKEIVSEQIFVDTMRKEQGNLVLKSLEFLTIETRRKADGQLSSARVVVKSALEGQGEENTLVVDWTRESGEWRCDSVGVFGSPLLGRL